MAAVASAASRRPHGTEAGAPVVPLRPPGDAATAWLGMVVFLGSWAMMFAGLFFAYGLVRVNAPAWPPPDQPRLPLLLPGLNAALVLVSDGAMALSRRWLRAGRPRLGAGALLAATILGVQFLALQSVVWVSLWNAGLRPDGGPYASAFYALTVFHALHVLVGLFALGWLTVRAFGGALGPARQQTVRLWAMYWHFVGAVWVAMYLVVYLL